MRVGMGGDEAGFCVRVNYLNILRGDEVRSSHPFCEKGKEKINTSFHFNN